MTMVLHTVSQCAVSRLVMSVKKGSSPSASPLVQEEEGGRGERRRGFRELRLQRARPFSSRLVEILFR
jgi:hypothetical protein